MLAATDAPGPRHGRARRGAHRRTAPGRRLRSAGRDRPPRALGRRGAALRRRPSDARRCGRGAASPTRPERSLRTSGSRNTARPWSGTSPAASESGSVSPPNSLTSPAILLLDEPTTGLDAGLERKAMRLFRQLAGGQRSVVLVTHSTRNLDFCDRVLILGPGGRACFFGRPDEARRFFDVAELAEVYDALEATPSRNLGDHVRGRPATFPGARRDRVGGVRRLRPGDPAPAPAAGAAPRVRDAGVALRPGIHPRSKEPLAAVGAGADSRPARGLDLPERRLRFGRQGSRRHQPDLPADDDRRLARRDQRVARDRARARAASARDRDRGAGVGLPGFEAGCARRPGDAAGDRDGACARSRSSRPTWDSPPCAECLPAC